MKKPRNIGEKLHDSTVETVDIALCNTFPSYDINFPKIHDITHNDVDAWIDPIIRPMLYH